RHRLRERSEWRMDEGRSVLHVQLFCSAVDHISLPRRLGQTGRVGPDKGSGAKRPDRSEAGLVRVERQDSNSDVSGLQEGSEARWEPAYIVDWIRRVQHQSDTGVFGNDGAVG